VSEPSERRPDGPPGDSSAERRRVARVYAGYAGHQRKRRNWRAENPGNAAIRAELVCAVFAAAGTALAEAERVLDIGCGTGWWLAELASDERVHARLEGVELLAERTEPARRRVPVATIAVGDARRLAYEDHAFNVVTLFTVLSSLGSRSDVQQTLAEARRVLAPGGTLLIWEPRVLNPGNRNTLLVSGSMLAPALAGMEVRQLSTTVVPALARRLGPLTGLLYPWLGRLVWLRTHRLICAVADPGRR
jgi:SAM-dependent methyltransferase